MTLGVYRREVPNAHERETGAAPLTQFGRMCAALGIQIIPASSPQAKGRIERNHGTHQDRLVKKLRRRAIRDQATANAFLATEYWADHNARFAQAPTSPDDFHLRAPARTALDRVFRLEESRVVANDWVVRYHNRLLQLERRSPLPPARSTVLVCEDEAGQLEIRYCNRPVRWTELATPRPVLAPPQPPPLMSRTPVPRPTPWQPAADHPWRRSQDYARVRALSAVRRAWTALNPDDDADQYRGDRSIE